MGSTPKVTINVKGASAAGNVSAEDAEAGLHMLYLQAYEGKTRHQWVVFPPPVKVLGVNEQAVANHEGKVKVLTRTQEFVGNRSKWFHNEYSKDFFDQIVQNSARHDLSKPLVVELELDDYRKVWENDTPHKALRAVERAMVSVLRTNMKGEAV